ncbi:sugar ABC transporter permease [Actinocatenispora comari]|uniref:Uncharacterized protein n=1 Tax=Actinocatenispora comari TaxID=2807577 RepID=A0A8J4EQ17_9ACTN|nr:sugar ABC transporter permease [Actinocatenispora comari]GIL31960.1 hypothetical protein NUM_72140 [Actinocatenispora comari]
MSAPAPYPSPAMPPATNPPVPVRPTRSGPPGWVGLLLALPMALGWLYWLVIPTLQTVIQAFTGKAPGIASKSFPGSAAAHGGEFADPLGTIGNTLIQAALPTLVMLIVVPLLSFAAAEAPTVLRRVVRALLAVLAAGFAPAVVVVAWRHLSYPPDGFAHGMVQSQPKLAVLVTLATIGLIAGIGVSVLLAALRRRATDRPGRTLGGAVVTWAVLVLGTFAIGLQAISFTLMLAPGRDTTTLGTRAFQDAFMLLRFGQAAADSTILFIPVAVLGLAAGLIVILARPRLELDRSGPSAGPLPRPSSTRAVVLGVLALAGAVALLAAEAYPRLGLLTEQRTAPGPDSISGTLTDALLPALLATVVQLLLAYPAGIGIGAFRPLGRHSHWLLLPFMPWLFVTATPLLTVSVESVLANGHMNSFLGAIPPILVSVPALLVFTLFGAGHGYRWRAAQAAHRPAAFLRTVLVPSLPLLGVVAMATWLYQAHDFLWRYSVVNDMKHAAADVALLRQLGMYTGGWPSPGLLFAAAPLAIPALLVFAVAQIWYLDRLALRLGDPGPEPGAVAAAGPYGGPVGPAFGGPGFDGADQAGPRLGGLPPAAFPPGAAPGTPGAGPGVPPGTPPGPGALPAGSPMPPSGPGLPPAGSPMPPSGPGTPSGGPGMPPAGSPMPPGGPGGQPGAGTVFPGQPGPSLGGAPPVGPARPGGRTAPDGAAPSAGAAPTGPAVPPGTSTPGGRTAPDGAAGVSPWERGAGDDIR